MSACSAEACRECAAPSERATPSEGLSDRIGVGVSATCAVHCAAVGSLSLAPSLSSSLGFLESFEVPLLVLALLIGLWSLVPAYRKHRRWQPLGLFLVGLGHLFVSRIVEGSAEIVITVLGVGCIALAHVINLRFCSECQSHHRHGAHPH